VNFLNQSRSVVNAKPINFRHSNENRSNDIPISFKLDTGAECDVISLGLANELNAQVQPTNMLLKSFGGHELDTVGKCLLETKVKEGKGSTPLEFYVLRDNVRPLLALE